MYSDKVNFLSFGYAEEEMVDIMIANEIDYRWQHYN